MTLDKVIERVRNLKSGYDVSDEDIISYINEVEMEIISNVISNREGDNYIVGTYGNYLIDTDRDFDCLPLLHTTECMRFIVRHRLTGITKRPRDIRLI